METEPETKKNILVLGGTKFMGKFLLESLSRSNKFSVFYVNRARGYWGNPGRLFLPNTTLYYGNRDHKKEFYKLMVYISNKFAISASNPWHVVYDFSCYEPKELKSVHLALKGRIRLYVFVSSDSVYEVCEESLFKGSPVEENHAVRPENPEKRLKKRKSDPYGDGKMKCEEYLRARCNKGDFPFVCLRLPDVIGPFDLSHRLWAYHIFFEKALTWTLHVDSDAVNVKLSFVFSEDAVFLMLSLAYELPQGIIGSSFNLACEENPTLVEFLNLVSLELVQLPMLPVKIVEDDGKANYPSVECGPLSIQKAKEILKWSPTPLPKVVKACCEFFKMASRAFIKEAEDARAAYEKLMNKQIKLS